MARRLGIIGGIIILFLVFGQYFIPKLVSDMIGKSVATLTNADKVDIEVNKNPALLMLNGQFDDIIIKAERAKTDKVVFDQFDINLHNVHIDMGNLMKTHQLTNASIEDVAIHAYVSQEELANTINKSVKGAKDAKVEITPEQVKVFSLLNIGGLINAQIRLEGTIVGEAGKIVFKTEKFHIDNGIIGNFSGKLFTDLVLLDLDKLPFNVEVKSVVLEQGRAVIVADNRH